VLLQRPCQRSFTHQPCPGISLTYPADMNPG
jgi:hypothetical protein